MSPTALVWLCTVVILSLLMFGTLDFACPVATRAFPAAPASSSGATIAGRSIVCAVRKDSRRSPASPACPGRQ